MAGQRYNPDTGTYEDIPTNTPEMPQDPTMPADRPTGSYQDFDDGSRMPTPRPAPPNFDGVVPWSEEIPGHPSGGVASGQLVSGQSGDPVGDIFKKYGISPGETDKSNYEGKNPEDQAGYLAALEAQAKQRAGNTPNQGANPYSNYLGNDSSGGGNNALSDLLSYLKEWQGQEDAQRKSMRDILMKQIDANSQPVTADDPQIHSMIASQQLARQRAAERQRSQVAAGLATNHLGSSGASDTAMNAIEQQRGEGEAHDTASTMANELTQRRGVLQNLLNTAVQSGDTQSAQTLPGMLAGINTQLNDSHFQQDLGYRQSSFLDDLGFRLLALQLGANANAAGTFL